MTTNAAELLRINKTRGGIGEGFRAQTLSRPRKPSRDIKASGKFDFVMKDGKIVRKPVSR
jgi:imidazolonepropionase-like amidohydrolase